jgi:hypothetical protein
MKQPWSFGNGLRWVFVYDPLFEKAEGGNG